MSSTPFHLNGKTILITGGSSGIGQATAQAISQMDGHCILVARDEGRLKNAMEGLNGAGHSYRSCDLMDESQRAELVESLAGIDGIVHSAGVVNPFPIKFLNTEKLNETFGINYHAPVNLTAELLKKKKLNKGASHVFISSISADHPHKGGSVYAGSKAALQAFCKTVALETYHLKMRANCVSPAMVKTPMYDKAEAGMSKENMDEHVSQYPLGVGTVEDVANSIVFLLSDASKWITGINITLDGGFLLEAK